MHVYYVCICILYVHIFYVSVCMYATHLLDGPTDTTHLTLGFDINATINYSSIMGKESLLREGSHRSAIENLIIKC